MTDRNDLEPKTGDRTPENGDLEVWGRSSVDNDLSPFRELKPEQQLAAHTLDRHISVTAGPGAGKTTVLVERYLHILRTQDISLDQIVAITFTNRAANEMRERLRQELDKQLWSAELAERAKWMRHKRTLDGAIITTIHGFCARLLREFPVEADIDPQFALLDAHQSSMLEEAIAEESLTEFINAEDRAITELAAVVGRARLARGLIDIYRSMRNQGLSTGRLVQQTEENHRTIENYDLAINETTVKMSEFIQAPRLTSTVKAKQREAAERWPSLLKLLSTPGESIPAAVSKAILEFREATRPNAQGVLKELVQELDELIWEKDLRGRIPQIFLDLKAKTYTRELIKALERLERRLDEEKRRRSSLDFDDLQVRALRLLEERPEVLRRMSSRYRFFLVDEFQDTNGLQRDLLTRLTLGGGMTAGSGTSAAPRANLFIVGDRKQSIYGFRGADVDVFREMTARIEALDGLPVPLNRNFRSQRPLIRFFNVLFEQVCERKSATAPDELNELGYVGHEESVAAREDEDPGPLVELLIDLRPDADKDDPWSAEPPRARDAEQLASRIATMVGSEAISAGERPTRTVEYRDIALLFRAMTEVHIYESAFRRAGIPYVTTQGRGFYAREEIGDFIQLLRFLDNKTDEVALAAVLRSPICGLSDDALFALRCAPLRTSVNEPGQLHKDNSGVRPLLEAVRRHEQIDYIDERERGALNRAREMLDGFILKATRSGLSELLRFAVDATEYRTVTGANYDGAQRLANLDKLFTLAERFERSGAHLIRDFVRFVHDFEEAGGRESEGQIDDSADAVRLMSIHQSKGLEFPIVIIPDLHRQPDNRRDWWALDRHRGLTMKVLDGLGKLIGGATFSSFWERAKRRDEFESMRLLYVAATRARDRLILSGAAKDLAGPKNSWLDWTTKALAIESGAASGLLLRPEGVEVQLTLNLLDSPIQNAVHDAVEVVEPELRPAGDESFPLLGSIESERLGALHRFSVTQLLNYRRCPRQYYFDRVLHVPSEEEVAVWNHAEAPEPPANLTATLRGAVIHRFCERFTGDVDLHQCLKRSFEEVLTQRAAEFGDRISEIDSDKAVRDLLPLARNYAGSKVRERIDSVHAMTNHTAPVTPHSVGVFSEQRFRLRRPLGILTGTIDKLMVVPNTSGNALSVEIIDFKTNRFRGGRGSEAGTAGRRQMSFDFIQPEPETRIEKDLLIRAEIEAAARVYQVQMQAYALAARDLIPGVSSVQVTLHFLDPDVELSLPESLLEREVCAAALDETMLALVSSSLPEYFEPNPAEHCRMCKFAELCSAGRQWLASATNQDPAEKPSS
jgi:ATP-dependent helicase/nuclease subunit A